MSPDREGRSQEGDEGRRSAASGPEAPAPNQRRWPGDVCAEFNTKGACSFGQRCKFSPCLRRLRRPARGQGMSLEAGVNSRRGWSSTPFPKRANTITHPPLSHISPPSLLLTLSAVHPQSLLRTLSRSTSTHTHTLTHTSEGYSTYSRSIRSPDPTLHSAVLFITSSLHHCIYTTGMLLYCICHCTNSRLMT